jgi:hypothetical protein
VRKEGTEMKFRFGRASFDRETDTFIELNTLEDLLEIVRKEERENKKRIIIGENTWDKSDDADFSLLVYDDYLE